MEPPIPRTSSPPDTRSKKLYALKFISGKYQGGEFPMPEEGEIVIGRSSDLDMVLVEDMVSRRHAKFIMSAGELYLQDLGSTNGSFVNGEKVTRTKLNEGDRILIGTSIIKVVLTSAETSLEEAKADLQNMAAGKRTSQVRTMTGSIAEVPLPDLLQLFGASKKSGVLVVITDTDTGRIYLDRGQVAYAAVDGSDGMPPIKAFCRIMTWKEGTFDMEPPVETQFPEPIGMSTEGLLMEAMRQLDELTRLEDSLPPRDSAIGVVVPLEAKLRELSPDELDVLQLVINEGIIEGVLNRSKASELETAEILGRLMQRGYVGLR
jgi:hypothetical protein